MAIVSELRIGPLLFERQEKEFPKEYAILFTDEDAVQVPVGDEMGLVFRASVDIIKRRLDFLGFTLGTALSVLERGLATEIEGLSKLLKNVESEPRKYELDWGPYAESIKNRIATVKEHTAVSWLESMRDIHAHPPWAVTHPFADSLFGPSLNSLCRAERFPISSETYLQLRCELEVTTEDFVCLDVSQWLRDGAFGFRSISWCAEAVDTRTRNALRLIVLTEGGTDRFILSNTLLKLYPELAHMVSFMDFDSLKLPGGASVLANLVRSFAGAGIRDRIVAVFDNDTAGSVALQDLSNLELPDNIQIMKYPDLAVLRHYPTQGPTGITYMDVNGSAASIELYLGNDILNDETGKPSAVQWNTYEPKLARYQGEVINKRQCFNRFREKLKKFESPGHADDESWLSLRLILEAIFSAFNDLDRRLLLIEEETMRNESHPPLSTVWTRSESDESH